MKKWKDAVLPLDSRVRDAVESMNSSGLQIVLICSDSRVLKGVITDGDIRRGLLQGLTLECPVDEIMNTDFRYGSACDDNSVLLRTMRKNSMGQLPILSDDGRIQGLKSMMDLIAIPEMDNWVVLMAGGLGSRLMPFTQDCPKPLLPVGGKPILETIIEQFRADGFSRFFISLNYRGDMIQSYFGDGAKIGVQIEYVKERAKLGTAGALGLLSDQPDKPLFVMNGDLLTKVDFQKMLAFHEQQKAAATMAVRCFEMQVPFGVVNVEESDVVSIKEKPVQSFFVNAGIYILSPDVVVRIDGQKYLDMPTMFDELIKDGEKVAAFPIHEYWMDIGQPRDFDKANIEYDNHFASAKER